jgi:hypothetical protein
MQSKAARGWVYAHRVDDRDFDHHDLGGHRGSTIPKIGAARQSIDNYTLDKQAAPQSLDDLAQAGYLRLVPRDPMTGAADWDVQFDSVVLSPDQSGTGLVDVHSHSGATSPFEGTPYNQW